MSSLCELLLLRNQPIQRLTCVFALFITIAASSPAMSLEAEPFDDGPYPVGTSNMRVNDDFSNFSDEEIHFYLSGHIKENGENIFVTDQLEYPQDALVVKVDIPDDEASYGNIAGTSLPVVIYINYPTSGHNNREHYDFPFREAEDTEMRHMQGPGEKPIFADDNARYPLVLISHGRNVHGIWETGHARRLASHGYIVVTVNYGDLRIQDPESLNRAVLFRPLAAYAVLDYVLSSDDFGSHIDHTRIATSGHSLGGFTSLALAGGRYLPEPFSVYDPRVSAVVAIAPWVGGVYDGRDYSLFEDQYSGLKAIDVPVLGVFGSNDQSTPKSTILAGIEQLSGPRYVVELIDQPHVFEPGSWQDMGNWELLFLSAYLKQDEQSLKQLQTTTSMKGGNRDIQHFEYQKTPSSAELNTH
jgi:dienelactone hydrolase